MWLDAPDNNAMHAKPDLRVLFIVMIYRSGSVIVVVMQQHEDQQEPAQTF